jgi:hypothetical protein
MSIPSYSLAALGRRVTFQPHEALAVAQSLIDGTPFAPPEAPYGPPSLDTVEVREDGLAACIRSDAKPAVPEIALLLEAMLPPPTQGVPPGVRYAIARALLETEAPPFDSIDDFSRALRRHEQGDRTEVLRGLVERFEAARAAARVLPWHDRRIERRASKAPGAQAEVELVRRSVVPERRRSGRVDELRRELREHDIRAYRHQAGEDQAVVPQQAAVEEQTSDRHAEPEVAGVATPARRHARRWSTAAAIVAGAIASIAGGEFIRSRVPGAASNTVTRQTSQPPSNRAYPLKARPEVLGSGASPANAENRLAAPTVPSPKPPFLGTLRPSTQLVAEARQVARNADFDEGTLVPALDRDQRPVFSPSFASNGSAMFFHSGDSHDARSALQVADLSGDLRVFTIVDDGSRNYHVQPSPDSRSIAFDSDRDGERGVYIADRDGTNVRRVSGPGYAAVPTWAPDGKRIAFVRAEEHNPRVWNLWLLSLESGDMRQLTKYRYGQPWSASWFPDGHRIAYTHEDKIVVLDLADGRTREFSSPVAGHLVRTPAVSPDGTKIIFQVYRQGAWLLNVADGSMLCALTDGTAEEFAWAPDGRRVAFHSRRDGEWGIYVMAK